MNSQSSSPIRPLRPHFAVSAVLAACLSLLGSQAHALALGRITVLSALGESLRAEIDVPDINAEEANSLRINIGSVDSFRRAGMEFNSVLNGAQVNLARRADGRAYLKVTSDRVVNDPFLDLVVEANWGTGQLVRDYTLLLDPPGTRQQTTQPSTTPITSSSQNRNRVTANTEATSPRTDPTPVAPIERAERPAPKRNAGTKPAATPSSQENGQQVTVRPGDTASRIASAIKPANVSLDQMLVALLRANPEAFGSGNVNRLKAGAVLNMPSSEAITNTSAVEASRIVVAQSRDFNDFRHKLAGRVNSIAAEGASTRSTSGKVQAQLEDKQPTSSATDKLSLQKGAVAGKNTQEQLAKEMQARETEKRTRELEKNIQDLKKLAPTPAASSPAAPAAPTLASSNPAGAVSGIKVPVTSPVPLPATSETTAAPAAPTVSAPVQAASSPVSAPAAVASKPAETVAVASAPVSAPNGEPAASAPVPVKPIALPAPPAPAPESDFFSDLLDNPLMPALAGGLVAALAGLGYWRYRQRAKAGQIDSSFMESRLQPDSFFGSSGGQKIDTNEGGLGASSMMYSPSQLDAGADVDPVAEADVYLAYGRDLQAEEILREALRINPSRAAIHFKLLQIHAKRRDVKAYAISAGDAYKLTGGLGTEWAQACEVGRELDPTNPLYFGEGSSGYADLSPTPAPAAGGAAGSAVDAAAKANPVDLDLDLDFSATPAAAAPIAAPVAQEPAIAEIPLVSEQPLEPKVDFAEATKTAPLPIIDLETPKPEMAAGPVIDTVRATIGDTYPATLKASIEHEPLEFNMDSLSLDLEPPQKTVQLSPHHAEQDDELGGEDPLATKLALAEEFKTIGDNDGARTLAQEVIDEASGALKAKAQSFLSSLG